MIATIVIAAATCFLLIVTVFLKPQVQIKHFHIPLYPLVALLGAVCMIAFTPLTFRDCFDGITGAGAVNPLKILALFLSVTAISVFLDEAGFFQYLAAKVLHRAAGQFKLFTLLYFTVSVLTVFTSNDIIILTFTPFLVYFCRNAKIDPLPYLIAEFTAANTWSMALVIGNPTNVYLATSAGLDFFSYFKIMALPAVLTGLAAYGILYLLFFKKLRTEIVPVELHVTLKDKPQCILGVVMLSASTLLLAISGYVGVEMWLACTACAGALIVSALVICLVRRRKPYILKHALVRVPYELILFVLSMFVVSLALERAGVTETIARGLAHSELILYGLSSFFASNLVNNIPMSVIFSSVISTGGAGNAAVFASIVGSNLGALFTPVGALAGIMFSAITKKQGVRFSAVTFIRYGAVIGLALLAVSLASLALVLYAF